MEWDGYVSELFHFSTAQEDMLATPHIPQVWGMFWDNLYDSFISWIAMFMFTLSSSFPRDEQRFKCGGTCWRSLSHKIWQSKWTKMTTFHVYSMSDLNKILFIWRVPRASMFPSVLQESLIFTGKTYLKWGNKVQQCEELVTLIKMDT